MKTKAQKKSDRLALEELSDGIESLEPVKKREPVWKPKLGDLMPPITPPPSDEREKQEEG